MDEHCTVTLILSAADGNGKTLFAARLLPQLAPYAKLFGWADILLHTWGGSSTPRYRNAVGHNYFMPASLADKIEAVLVGSGINVTRRTRQQAIDSTPKGLKVDWPSQRVMDGKWKLFIQSIKFVAPKEQP